ncbi:DNA polymerase III subunit delta [Patescibacteria group bacterium]|nr:MAG: DNA polymerase III subunit delta [Patescibacteria group bacterium]
MFQGRSGLRLSIPGRIISGSQVTSSSKDKLDMLFFFYGPDTFRSGEKVVELKRKYLEKNQSQLAGLVLLDFETSENEMQGAASVERALGEQGLFSAKRFVVVQGFSANSSPEEQEKLLEFLMGHPEIIKSAEQFLLFREGEPKAERKSQKGSAKKTAENKLIKYLMAQAKVELFEALSGSKLEKWVMAEAQKFNSAVKFSQSGLTRLLALCGHDLARLRAETEKLVTYRGQGEVTVQDVDMLVQGRVAADIFQTIEALSAGDKKQAIALLHKQLAAGSDPFEILAMYVYQLRTLLKIAELAEQGVQSPMIISQKTGLHSFVVQKGLPQVRRWGFKKLARLFQQLAEIDTQAKMGKIQDLSLALELLIMAQ